MAPSKVIVVTGASRGIGKSIVHHLAKPLQNCNVLAIARSKHALLELKEQAGDCVEVLDADLSDLSVASKAVDLALKKWSRIDGLILNHGALEPLERIADVDPEQWKRSLDVNVISHVAFIKAALPALRESQGTIVFTSSGAAVKGTATWGAYSAGKAVLNSLARTLAAEELKVTTIAIRPGVVDTEMQGTIAQNYGSMDRKDADRFSTMREQGKMLRPEQPGNVMARLVLDADRELSGEFVNWDDAKLKKFQDL